MRVPVGQSYVNDDPGNVCFGCSPHNTRGLRLSFVRTSEHAVETHYTAEDHLCGMRGVIHGGIQATLLDEVLGTAARFGLDAEEDVGLATVEIRVRYRRPAPSHEALTIRGEFDRVDGKDVHVRGSIVNAEGTLLTEADGRFRRFA
jgi:uncharacterized protein (TIGR00369 family)